MSVTLQSTRDDGSTSTRTFNFSLANDQSFTPLLAYVALANTIGAYERQFGAATFAIKSRAHIKGHDDLTLEDVFTGENATLGAATASPDRSRCSWPTIVEPITVERARHHGRVERNVAHRHHRTRLARRSASARRPHGSAQGADPQLPRRGEDLHRPDRNPRATCPGRCRCWSPTAGS